MLTIGIMIAAWIIGMFSYYILKWSMIIRTKSKIDILTGRIILRSYLIDEAIRDGKHADIQALLEITDKEAYQAHTLYDKWYMP